MNTDSVYCIVDVQDAFIRKNEYGTKRIVKYVTKRIREYKKKNQPIFLIKFKKCGNVLPQIRNELRGYKYLFHSYKTEMDGSNNVIKRLKKMNVEDPNEIRVCGVYTDLCVANTIKGFFKQTKNTKIKIDFKECISHPYRSLYEASKMFHHTVGKTSRLFVKEH